MYLTDKIIKIYLIFQYKVILIVIFYSHIKFTNPWIHMEYSYILLAYQVYKPMDTYGIYLPFQCLALALFGKCLSHFNP